jgi:large subunit ribosomal protein L13
MKIIDGKDAVLGRLAAYAAKEALKGEEIAVVNCEKIVITGSRKNIEADFQESREKIGSGQKGPKVSRTSEKIVKRAIRGMLPDHREGRGRIAYKKIKCYVRVPPEFEGKEMIVFKELQEPRNKFIRVETLSKRK